MKRLLPHLIIFTLILLATILPASAIEYTGWLWPVQTSLRMSRGYFSTHTAIDIVDVNNSVTPIYASRSGTVKTVYSGCNNYSAYSTTLCTNKGICSPTYNYWDGTCNNGFGNGVIIDHGNGVQSEYAHMTPNILVTQGQYVTQGTIIGYMGSSGASTGRHLHFALKENGSYVNNNPIGDQYYCSGEWNGIDTIYYSHDYSGASTPSITAVFSEFPDKYSVSDTNACLSQRLDFSGGLNTLVGIKLYNASGALVVEKTEVPNISGNYTLMWYDVNSELNYIMTPGTTYTYKFLAVVGGKEFYSPSYTVTTTGKNTQKINVYFDGNGGTPSFTAMQVDPDGKYGEMPTATRPGYTFNSWTAERNPTGMFIQVFTTGSLIYSNSDHTLYARWNANTYNVNFDPAGGYVSVTSQTARFDSAYGALPVPTREGYTFAGWYTSDNVLINENSIYNTVGDQQLWAHWNEITVTGVTLDKAALTLTEGDTVTLSATVMPSNAANRNVTWTSSNAGAASVEGGVVTANAAGTATITATSANGMTASCVIIVEPKEVYDPNALTFAISEAKAVAGGTVAVTLSVTNNTGIAGMAFSIGYDSSVMTLKSYECNSAWIATSNFYENSTYNPVSFSWSRPSDSRIIGDILTLVFEIKENAPEGEYAITLKQNGVVTNQSLDEIKCNVVSGKITVIDCMIGDVSGDGKIDSRDAVVLSQLLANWSVNVNKTAADCTGDGKVDSRDAVLLAQYLANWNVTLG